jgi:alanyl-tRNA synthetase
VLYATSGGQIHDEGVVIKGNDSFEVIDVIKGPNGQHFVQINSDGIKISLNDSVDIKINKQFRNLVSKNHSVEHILEKVMRENIDSNIKQLGAFKSPDKMTFDFQLSKKLDDSQINSIEEKINVIIKNGSEVETILTDLEEAKKSGAVAHFDEVYSKIKGKLRLVCMKGQVNEICGGTNVRKLYEIEEFMIVKLVSKGSGM